MTINRRTLIAGAATLAASSTLAAPALAQAKTKVRIGYLHTIAVDGQIWLADHLGAWGKHGLEPDFKQFQTGLELFQAMVGGSLDMLSTGAVISNFPARGQGKMFIANCVEYATAQLWVREDQGIKSFADLKGKRHAADPDGGLVGGHGAAGAGHDPRVRPAAEDVRRCRSRSARRSSSGWPRRRPRSTPPG